MLYNTVIIYKVNIDPETLDGFFKQSLSTLYTVELYVTKANICCKCIVFLVHCMVSFSLKTIGVRKGAGRH
jgi:hypothetical protein